MKETSLLQKVVIVSVFMWFSFCTALFSPSTSYAASSDLDGTSLSDAICNVVGVIQGKFGVGLSSFAIIFLGVGLFFGKVSWGLALAVVLAIACIFGASTIVNVFTDADTTDSCNSSGGTTSP